jgi:hypothetical protein
VDHVKEEEYWGFAPNPRIYRFSARVDAGALPREKDFLLYHRIAWQEDRATQGCDPSAEPGPEWTAASGRLRPTQTESLTHT